MKRASLLQRILCKGGALCIISDIIECRKTLKKETGMREAENGRSVRKVRSGIQAGA